MKIDCQRLLSVSLQNGILAEGRGPGRMPLWSRKVYLVYSNFDNFSKLISYAFRLVIEKYVEAYVEFDQ